MKRKSLFTKTSTLLLAASMILAIFSGCGDSSTSSTTSNASNTSKTESTTSVASEGDTGGGETVPEGRTEIRFTTWANTGEIKVLKRAVDEFNEKQDKIFVTYETSASDTYEQKLITALAGGKAWDAFYVGDATVSILIKNGSIATMNDFLETDKSYVKPGDFADGLWGAAKTDSGDIYGLAVDCNPNLLYYQPSLIKEVGAKSPQEYFDEGKWDWAAFDDINQKFVDNGKAGFLLGKDIYHMYRFVAGNGGNIWDGETYKFDDKATEAFQYVADRINDGRFTYSGTLPEGQGEDAQFISGLCGFMNAGRWQTPTLMDAGVEHDYIPYPSSDGSKFPPSLISVAYLSVNDSSPNKEAAMEFASYYVSQDGQKARLSSVGDKPGNAIPSVDGIDNIITDSGVPEHVSYLFDVKKTGWAMGSDFAKDVRYPGLTSELRDLAEEVWVNGQTVTDMIPKIEAKANEMVAEFKAEQ